MKTELSRALIWVGLVIVLAGLGWIGALQPAVLNVASLPLLAIGAAVVLLAFLLNRTKP